MKRTKQILTLTTLLAFIATLPGCASTGVNNERAKQSITSFNVNEKNIKHSQNTAIPDEMQEDNLNHILAGIGTVATGVGYVLLAELCLMAVYLTTVAFA